MRPQIVRPLHKMKSSQACVALYELKSSCMRVVMNDSCRSFANSEIIICVRCTERFVRIISEHRYRQFISHSMSLSPVYVAWYECDRADNEISCVLSQLYHTYWRSFFVRASVSRIPYQPCEILTACMCDPYARAHTLSLSFHWWYVVSCEYNRADGVIAHSAVRCLSCSGRYYARYVDMCDCGAWWYTRSANLRTQYSISLLLHSHLWVLVRRLDETENTICYGLICEPSIYQ